MRTLAAGTRSLRLRPCAAVVAFLAVATAVPCSAQTEGELPPPTLFPPDLDVATEAESRSLGRFLLDRAKERFNRGVLSHDATELEAAFDVLNLGRTLELDATFEFNAARVAEELEHCLEARLLYQRFLDRGPAAAQRARAEQRLKELAHCDPSELTAATSVLPGRGLGVVSPPVWRSARSEPLALPALASRAVAAENRVPRWVSWGLAGGGAASAVLSVLFLVQAGSRDAELARLRPDSARPEAAPGRIDRLQEEGRGAQTRARIFGALAAGLGVAAGVGFWVSSRGPEQPTSELTLRASPSGAGATWQQHF